LELRGHNIFALLGGDLVGALVDRVGLILWMGHIYKVNMVLWGLSFAPKGSSAAHGWFCRDIITVEISFHSANGLMLQWLFNSQLTLVPGLGPAWFPIPFF
jgi:hypothetical protein